VPPDTPDGARAARDLAFYEELISRGIAEADARGSAIDHVTARRLALWLLPRSQDEPPFMRGLIHFARTGGITDTLRKHLQHHARSPSHPSRPHAARLLQYAVARGNDLGRIGDNFGAVCDQIDRADTVLEDLRDRVLESRMFPPPVTLQRGPLRPIAMAHHDQASDTVTFIVDPAIADAAIYAITSNAMEREARIRHIQQASQHLPEGSYGRENREAIIARETQITNGLRAIEGAYRAALHPTPAPELSRVLPPPARTPDHELELELE
jgi:hypothetical protein